MGKQFWLIIKQNYKIKSFLVSKIKFKTTKRLNQLHFSSNFRLSESGNAKLLFLFYFLLKFNLLKDTLKTTKQT